ncbi:MAG: hypothetical protein IPO98_16445 [Saprospiraceae bacterium]|nr:hypothetical protein [Saprospiraceae bacterium]
MITTQQPFMEDRKNITNQDIKNVFGDRKVFELLEMRVELAKALAPLCSNVSEFEESYIALLNTVGDPIKINHGNIRSYLHKS